MPPVAKGTVWRLVHCQGERTREGGEEYDVLAFGLLANGKSYAVTVTGPAQMMNTEVLQALQATAAHWVAMEGGDPRKVVPTCAPMLEDETTPAGKTH